MASRELPSDLIFDIISRTPSLKTLDRCKAVCKEWNKRIYETNFMPLYCLRTKNVSGYFVQGMKHSEYFSDFVSFDQGGTTTSSIGRMLPPDTRILASCRQGILCCVRRKDTKYRYFACKPTTGQWQPLPNPRRHYKTVAVAIMVLRSNPLRYKIVRLSKLRVEESKKGCYSYRCGMFDSETWKWRKVGDVHLSYNELIIRSTPSTVAGNSVYWLTSNDNVVGFCEADESFNKFSLPEHVRKNNTAYKYKQLLEYEGRLGFVCLRDKDGYMELWLRERDNMSWTKKMEVDIEGVGTYASPAGFYNAGIVLLMTYFEAVFYKIQDCSLSRVKLDELGYVHEVFQFRSDFERVHLGRIC